MSFTTKNPYTLQNIKEYDILNDSKVEEIIEKAHRTYLKFRQKKPSSRIEKMLKIAEILIENKKKYAKQITFEMGKPISQSIKEIEKCALVCKYYAKHSEHLLQTESIKQDGSIANISKEPLGIIFGIMPWNYPFWQVFRVLAPNIMLGNSLIIKHSPNTLGCAEMISDIVEEAGFEKHTFSHVIINVEQVESIIANKYIKGVTFTGSTKAGSAVASLAGKYIKKSVLELGGSNALVVFEDADLDQTADICIKARFQNTGQSCIAGKRLLVHEKIYKEFVKKIKSGINSLKIGDPTKEDTYISVLARKDLAETLENQLKDSINQGARLISGGKRKDCFFEPTILESVTPEMTVFNEETFGPLLPITSFRTDEDALRLINQSDYGLGVSLFTKNEDRFNKLYSQIEDGAVFKNATVKSQPDLPFGGTKNSGYGRELGKEGILEFANIKTIYK